MSKRDVLDERMAQWFAWRRARPGEMPDVTAAAAEGDPPPPAAAPDAKPPDEQRSLAEQERRKEATRACAELARQVARVWDMTPPSRKVAAIATLLERVRALGSVDIRGMRAHPQETVRLLRLIARNYRKLPSADRKASIRVLTLAPVSPLEREVVDLLVEVAEADDRWLTFLIDQGATHEAMERRPDIGERLASVLDHGTTWAARETAARWLARADFPSSIPSLQRALRLPHARIRWGALHALCERTPRALTEGDLLWLLEDAVAHPLSAAIGPSGYKTNRGYEDALIEAVRARCPASGWRPLALIADGGGALIRGKRPGLDTAFALRALATVYPVHALARIDRALAGSRSDPQFDAIHAAALLPEELARPRLLDAAAGPKNATAELAIDLWFKRFGAECPRDPLAGVPAELLLGPPSEAFFARLTVLRGSSTEAAGALLAALLAEEPAALEAPAEREALALLLFTLRNLRAVSRRPDLPSDEEAWARRLLERFGEPALSGLFTLAERGALAGIDHGWLGALVSLARKGKLTGPSRDRLRDLAVRALGSPAFCAATAPLLALTVVGPPPELCDFLWSLATRLRAEDVPGDGPALARACAIDALCEMKDAPALDERIAREAERALRDRPRGELTWLVNISCRRRLPSAFAVVTRVLAELEEDPTLFKAAVVGAYRMKEAGRIDEAWVLDALGRPSLLRFAIATNICRAWTSRAILGALQRALSSPARAGAAAAEAAAALVAMLAITPADPRLDGILERAPDQARASLLDALFTLEAPLYPFRRHALELLLSADAKTAKAVFESLNGPRLEGTWGAPG